MDEKVLKLIKDFSDSAVRQFQFTREGNWRKGNMQVKKMNETYHKLKEIGEEGIQALLALTGSELPEVASLAAVYGMRFDPEKCLAILKKIADGNIPLLSSESSQAIENWENKEWYID